MTLDFHDTFDIGGGGSRTFVEKSAPLFSGTTNTEAREASLASYLPDDGKVYMLCIQCQVHSSTASAGSYINAVFDTDLTTSGAFTFGSAKTQVSGQEAVCTQVCWVPVGAGRKLSVPARTNDKGTFYVTAVGYYEL